MEKFKPNENYNHYLYWLVERMNIFWRKYNGEQSPWTADEIFQEFRFTNLYRVLDRVSQYLLKEVIYNGKNYSPEDLFYRILLFKHFNKIETWEALIREFGDITVDVSLDDIANFLDKCIQNFPIYSNAYMVGAYFYNFDEYTHLRGLPKHRAFFRVYKDEIFDNGYMYKILESESLEELYNRLRVLRIYGDFTAQQYAIDLNYSPLFNFSENDFVVTGPGSLRGIKFIFEGATGARYDYTGAIRWVSENFEERMFQFEKDSGMKFHPLPWEPVPTLTNLQNTLCEISKFAKGLGYKIGKGGSQRIKNIYHQTPGKIDYVFPPKWDVKLPLPGEIKVE